MAGERTINPVMVVGGGIAGVHAALGLADQGHYVYLVEKAPILGGRILHLDKIYPTDHCSFCLLWPYLLRCKDYPRIEILTQSTVKRVTGSSGDFRVAISRAPLFIREDRCTGCGECAQACPVEVPNPFYWETRQRKAIYRPHDHAVPDRFVIDEKQCNRCGRCREICPFDAIDLDAQAHDVEIDVQAVLLATGFDQFDPTPLEEYGYGSHPDIMTSLEFESWIAEDSSHRGKVKRRSDGRDARVLAVIQCVGSRDRRFNEYCSGVCCMAAVKLAVWACERAPDLRAYIFYTDMRASGRGHQEYLDKSPSSERVEYIRSRPGRVAPSPHDSRLEVIFEDTTTRQMKLLRADIVVLSEALIPSKNSADILKQLNSTPDLSGFMRPIPDLGCIHGSGDESIVAVESIFQASAAVAHIKAPVAADKSHE